MSVQVSSVQRKTNERLLHLKMKTETGVNSPLTIKTKASNEATPRKSVGYQINFFDIGKAKKYFNVQSCRKRSLGKMNSIRKMSNCKTEGNNNGGECFHMKQASMPLSIKITEVVDNRSKSRSKAKCDIPNEASKERMNTSISKTNTNSKMKEKTMKKYIKIEKRNTSRPSTAQENHYESNNKPKKVSAIRNKETIHHYHSNIKPRNTQNYMESCNNNTLHHKKNSLNQFNSRQILSKRESYYNTNLANASDLPIGLREKMLINYQPSNTIGSLVSENKRLIKCHKKNEAIPLSPSVNAAYNDNHTIQPLKIQFIDIRKQKVSQCSYDIDKAKDIDYSSPLLLGSDNKINSGKNRYRDLLTNYFSDDDAGKA